MCAVFSSKVISGLFRGVKSTFRDEQTKNGVSKIYSWLLLRDVCCVLSFESDNWFVGLHFVAPAKSQCICLDLILEE